MADEVEDTDDIGFREWALWLIGAFLTMIGGLALILSVLSFALGQPHTLTTTLAVVAIASGGIGLLLWRKSTL